MAEAGRGRKSRLGNDYESAQANGVQEQKRNVDLSQEIVKGRSVKVHHLCSCFLNGAISTLPGGLIHGVKADMRRPLHAGPLAMYDWCKDVLHMYKKKKGAHCRTSIKEKIMKRTGGDILCLPSISTDGKAQVYLSLFYALSVSFISSSSSSIFISLFSISRLLHLSSLILPSFNTLYIPTP